MSVPDHTQPSGQPCFACGSRYMILKQRCSFCLWCRVKTETDECSGSRGHLAASIQTDQSFTILSFLPSDQALPVETLSFKVRGHTNSPTPSSFSYMLSSISVYHILIHFPFPCLPSLPPSVALWPIDLTGGEITGRSALPWLSGPDMDCSW